METVQEPYSEVFVLLEQVMVMCFVVVLVCDCGVDILGDEGIFGDDVAGDCVEVFDL